MITSNMIYWLTRLDAFNSSVLFLIVIGFFSTVVWAVAYFFFMTNTFSKEEGKECTNFFIKKLIFIPLGTALLTIGQMFVPTTKEACAMYVIPKIANNENVQNLSKEVVDLAHAWIDELKPKHEEKQAEAKK